MGVSTANELEVLIGRLKSPYTLSSVLSQRRFKPMKPITCLLALVILAPVLRAPGAGADSKLWYDKPAARWETEALPIGNGRLGGMIFGGIQREQVQFNESSLWIGDERDTGAYQGFGDLFVDLGGGGIASAECASGQTSPGGESVESSIDGKAETKWCLEHHNQPVIWIGHCPVGMVVASYAFTSANDMPDRDPKSWTLEGSNDTQAWALLDQRTNEPPHAQRHQRTEYSFVNDRKFQHYRFTFFEHGSRTHFQVAEIELGKPARSTVTGYRRELDIARAVHTVAYNQAGVDYRREYFASHPAASSCCGSPPTNPALIPVQCCSPTCTGARSWPTATA